MANDEVVIKQYLIKYQHPDYTAKEVVNLIQRYKSLTCRLEVFVFNNGARKDLLNLEGTLPVSYKGAVYNIPVSIWLMDTHPENAPLCFVKPTADMSIKVSMYVDSNGKVYLPYLHSWNAKSSNLLGLIGFMINAFGEIPPVFTKRKLPYPVATQGPSFPYLQQNVPQPFIAPGPPYPANTGMPYPNFGSPYPGYPNPGANNGVSPFMPTNPPQPNTSYGPGTQGTAISGGTITEEHIAASLLSAVQDKLRRRLNEQAQQSSAELETLRRTQQELQTGQTRLDDILAKLQRERTDLDKNVLILQEKEKELEAAVERLSEQESVDVDEAVVTTAPIYSQLLNAFAKEATLEDAIYYMGEALRKEVIDLDTFLKQKLNYTSMLRSLFLKVRQ